MWRMWPVLIGYKLQDGHDVVAVGCMRTGMYSLVDVAHVVHAVHTLNTLKFMRYMQYIHFSS